MAFVMLGLLMCGLKLAGVEPIADLPWWWAWWPFVLVAFVWQLQAMLLVGLVLCGLKISEFTVVAQWPWWAVLAPFAILAIWWQIEDMFGLTQKRQMRLYEKKKADRRRRQLELLGLHSKEGRGSGKIKHFEGRQTRQASTVQPRDGNSKIDPKP